ncbi:hypothetical protein NZD89_12870 [Alicyclobacillus fastidiosus]|uniref:Uncharacterized protein n=1 Tax=Alicyclobacillus fastidiosus TaxID=392011 RepID=A0ABY6ZQ27_9BACL|nr:hypothetical protein [Alicyclobacillus fastidiosus]WAH44189.1 hypothetical protein NZD89_12870 [Alicyclobacillus fastidiosus]GMA60504.1 hypothetical protein GCM10025859_09440 [Alicyclobacillus fastidiosus]
MDERILFMLNSAYIFLAGQTDHDHFRKATKAALSEIYQGAQVPDDALAAVMDDLISIARNMTWDEENQTLIMDRTFISAVENELQDFVSTDAVD